MRARSDAELRSLTDVFRARVRDGEQLDQLLLEAFAAVREAARRVLGERPVDAQIMGGAALPLSEYRREAHALFTAMTKTINEEIVGYLFNIKIQPQD